VCKSEREKGLWLYPDFWEEAKSERRKKKLLPKRAQPPKIGIIFHTCEKRLIFARCLSHRESIRMFLRGFGSIKIQAV